MDTVFLILFLLVPILVIAVAGVVGFWVLNRSRTRQLADAREDALRWYERLGGQVMNLHGDDLPVKQALLDAGERYNAAGSQLERAKSVKQYELATETALEGLMYIRAARTALGIDPGPELPQLASQRRAGAITKEREVQVQGQTLRAGPQPGAQTPYYYPGGMVGNRPVPGGWYSTPWWKTALIAGAGTIGTMMVMDALFSPSFADPGYSGGGYDQGFDSGYQEGLDAGQGDAGQGDGSWGDAGDSGGDFGGGGDSWGDFGGDF
ncbi:MAG: hypothetical protein H0T78_10980 [Longispora sp.]|nr:hypothetical protein [Longispora sp. (in: high G+C Gram-positive bacteria)]